MRGLSVTIHLIFDVDRTMYSYNPPVLLEGWRRRKSSTWTPPKIKVTCHAMNMDFREAFGGTHILQHNLFTQALVFQVMYQKEMVKSNWVQCIANHIGHHPPFFRCLPHSIFIRGGLIAFLKIFFSKRCSEVLVWSPCTKL